jgi:hypothetical protein
MTGKRNEFRNGVNRVSAEEALTNSVDKGGGGASLPNHVEVSRVHHNFVGNQGARFARPTKRGGKRKPLRGRITPASHSTSKATG